MSDTLTDLAQYLLAYERPGGGKICRYGFVQDIIPVFPPGLSIVFHIVPPFNSHCSILIWNQWSPAMVPSTLTFDTRHQGIIMTSGPLSALALYESHNLWLEVTQGSPIITTITNISPLNQYFEAADLYLVVQTEDDLKKLHELVNKYGGAGGTK